MQHRKQAAANNSNSGKIDNLWIAPAEAAAALCVSPRHLRRLCQRSDLADQRSAIQTRQTDKLANGRSAVEILLESLPVEAQQRYYGAAQSDPSSLLHAPCSMPLSSPSVLAPSPGADPEGGQAADTSSAAAGVMPAPLSDLEVRSQTSEISKSGSERANVLNGLTESQLAELNNLAETLRDLRGEKSQVAQRLGMSPSTLDRKARALKKYGLAGLIRKPRADRGVARVADAKIVAKIKAEYLKPYRPAATHVHRAIAKDYALSGLDAPSYSFVRRTVQTIDPDLLARFRIGEREFDDKFAYITLRKKPPVPRQWCDADHHECDHYVIFADGSIGRPWLTAIQDICTDEILGYLLTREKRSTYPGAGAIALTLRRAILRKSDSGLCDLRNLRGEISLWPSFGLFDNFYADLGRDFRSQYVRAICADLGINIVHARGYHGKSKPIERWFGVLESGIKHLRGYCGKDHASNPERQRLGAPRSFEDMRGELMTIDQFEMALHNWIVNDFHHAPSRALKGISPIGALEAHIKNGWQPREVANVRALDLLMMQRKAKKVQRFGIQMFGTKGVQRFFGAPELLSLVGQEVEIFWDPANLGELIIYKDNRFLCKATNRELLDFGAREEDLDRERELKRTQRQSVQDRYEQMLVQAQYPNEMARATAERRREEVMSEERQKIAANAEPPTRVYKMLPKFQVAAKALHDGRTIGGPKLREVKSQKSDVGRGAIHRAQEAAPQAEELPSSEEIFKREVNPWLEEEE